MPDLTDKKTFSDADALDFHRVPTPGKISMAPTKPMATQRDLSLAYSPGVAVPVLAIAGDPDKAYDYTSKGNLVAVISNGTAILGLGNLGHMASKPVMEGKAVLFKRFADVDSFDVEVKTTDPDEFVTVVKNIGDTWGGINLEDIKSPECFVIESQLQDLLDIPVFHDDQHGTAIISTAGLINACHITGKKLEDIKVVLAGAGAAGLSSIGLMKAVGVRAENTVIVDRDGVVYKGRENIDQWKAAHATDTPHRTLAEAMVGADVVLGLSAKGAITKEMVASMAANPIIFAMANPDPEITPEDVLSVRSDAIMATGRSDYVNQVNNVLGFPYIFRGALDVRARTVNHEMKIACAYALAMLAREDVPDEVAAAYSGRKLKFGPDYIIPTPFDPRLIHTIPPAVAKAGADSGVARRPIIDMPGYENTLKARMDPTASIIRSLNARARAAQATMIFAEGDDPHVLRAAVAYQRNGFGKALVVGRESDVKEKLEGAGLGDAVTELEVINAANTHHLASYKTFLYERLQRSGFDRHDIHRLAARDRHVFASLMLAHGHGDALVTGATRKSAHVMELINHVFDAGPEHGAAGVTALLHKGRIVLVADTLVHEWPETEDLANIAQGAAAVARDLGLEPRVAFVSFSTFGYPRSERAEKMHLAPAILEARGVDFEFDGEMAADVALNPDVLAQYPFCRLSGPANVLVMPGLHSAQISMKLLASVSGATVLGPLIKGLSKPVQVVPMGATVADMVTLAALTAHEAAD